MSYARVFPLTLLMPLLAGWGCENKTNPPADMGTTRSLVLLHTTDEHSHVLGGTPEVDDHPAPTTPGTGVIKGGIARRAVILEQERAAARAAGADTLTLSAGDNTQGTLMQVPFATTAPDFRLMKSVNYDLTTFGNHEFDFGPKALADAINVTTANGGTLHVVCTTIQFSDTDPKDDELAALMDEAGSDLSKPVHRTFMITTPNGLKVGFVGTMGPLAATYAPFKPPVTFSLPPGAMESEIEKVRAQMVLDLQKYVDKLKNEQKADVVILLSHSGVDDGDMTQGDDYKFAQLVNGLDAIVSGHTHLRYDAITVTNPTTNKQVVIQQAGSFGEFVGKIALKVAPNGVVTPDLANSAIITIDDTIVGNDATVNALVDSVIKDLEGSKVIRNKSFLEDTLGAILGMSVTDNPAQVGDLFFKTIGTAPFRVIGKAPYKETPLMVLTADAQLVAGESVANGGGPTDFSLTVQGVMRADLEMGKTGKISFADVFNVLPLGIGADKTVGYPLTRFKILAGMMKAALEISTGYAYLSPDNSTYYMTTGGMKVEYDTALPAVETCMPQPVCRAADPLSGRITKISLSTPLARDTFVNVIYDRMQGGWQQGITPFGNSFTVVTSLYIASYAAVQGVTLLHPTTGAVVTNPSEFVLKRADGSEVKEWEALGAYIAAFPSSTLPARYDAAQTTFPRRMICSGPLCK